MTVSSENRVEIRDPQGGTIRDGPRPRRPRMRTFRTRKRTRTRTSEMRIFWTRTARTRNSEDVNFENFRNVQGRQGRRRPAEAWFILPWSAMPHFWSAMYLTRKDGRGNLGWLSLKTFLLGFYRLTFLIRTFVRFFCFIFDSKVH